MVAGEFVVTECLAAVETQIAVAAEQKFIFERGIGKHIVYLAIAGDDARQLQHRSDAAAIEPAPHLENGVAKRPDDLVFHKQCRGLFACEPAHRNTRFVQS